MALIKKLKKLHFVNYGRGNRLIIHRRDGTTRVNPRFVFGIGVYFRGAGSTLELYEPYAGLGDSVFKLYNNDHFIIGRNCRGIFTFLGGRHAEISIGDGCYGHLVVQGGTNTNLTMGAGCAVGQTKIVLANVRDAHVGIGNDCLFSNGVVIYASDTHRIVDNETRRILNDTKKYVEIGNHVWLGMRVTVLKGTKIANNSIVGACSVVSGHFDVPNVILAGVPARVVRDGVDWDAAALDAPNNF